MSNFLKLLLAVFLLSCGSSKFDSPVEFSKLFADGMVVQRESPVNVWGKGIPGENVRVSLAGAVSSGTVEADSSWHVQLPKLEAGGPFVLEINRQKINDVYVGDVWVAGGQSNMEWSLKSDVIGAQQEFDEGGIREIRFFQVPNSYSVLPQDDVVGGSWKVADSTNMKDFSAVAWFFAKRNHLEERVPVGIIESNWGGTPVEGWMDIGVLANKEGTFEKDVQDLLENQERWIKKLADNGRNKAVRDSMFAGPDSLKALHVASLDYNDTNWRSISLPEANPLQHISWARKQFTLSGTDSVLLHLPRIEQMAYLYVNGRQLYYKDWGKSMPEMEIPEGYLSKGKNVLTIRVINSWNNQPQIGSKGEMYLLQNGKKISLEGNWKYSNNIVEPHVPQVNWYNWKPGLMYNSMIHPLTNYTIKGVIWYQGESNAGRHQEYRELFSAMITNWRSEWDQGDFPFLFVQLANFMKQEEVQPESDWAYLREAQKQTLELPETGMAVIIDIGEEGDIHPRNKKDVGERLWLQAKKVAFNEQVLASGPEFDMLMRKENELLLRFKSIGKGLSTTDGEAPKSFIVSNQAGKFQLAKAELLDSATVRLVLPTGAKSGEVRYAWSDNPEVNLVNDLGLPAVPFKVEF